MVKSVGQDVGQGVGQGKRVFNTEETESADKLLLLQHLSLQNGSKAGRTSIKLFADATGDIHCLGSQLEKLIKTVVFRFDYRATWPAVRIAFARPIVMQGDRFQTGRSCG